MSRVVRGGSVVVDGRTYRPAPGDVPYTGQLDGRRCLFGRHIGRDGRPLPVLSLWGVWDPEAGEYSGEDGPHRVGDRYPFAVWSDAGEDPP